MKINDVQIANWKAPGDKWWKGVEDCPTEPLIEATMTMTLSWVEYEKLLTWSERNTVRAESTKRK